MLGRTAFFRRGGGTLILSAHVGVKPLEDGFPVRDVFDEQVGGLLKAVDVRLRQALAKIAQITLQEDGVFRTPHEKRGIGHAGDVSADALQFGVGRVVFVHRNVCDEAAHTAAALR